MTDIQELKRLAEAATPGPWENGCYEVYEVNGSADRICKGASAEDSAFIAAANPTAILSLISRIEELEKAIKPFADFNRSLPEYCYGESDIQSAWPEHTPVISRSYPLDMHHATYCALYVHDFTAAAIAQQGGKND